MKFNNFPVALEVTTVTPNGSRGGHAYMLTAHRDCTCGDLLQRWKSLHARDTPTYTFQVDMNSVTFACVLPVPVALNTHVWELRKMFKCRHGAVHIPCTWIATKVLTGGKMQVHPQASLDDLRGSARYHEVEAALVGYHCSTLNFRAQGKSVH